MTEYDRLKKQFDEMVALEKQATIREALPDIAAWVLTVVQEFDPDKKGSQTFDDAVRLAHDKVLTYLPTEAIGRKTR